MAQASPRQLMNTSWTVHRLSPLHHGKEFQTLLGNPVALKSYATRLRDQLTGDVLAGLQAGVGAADEDASLSKTGALKECTWEMLARWSQLDDEQANSDSYENAFGILVVLEYENITYKAALLAGPDDSRTHEKDSTFLPLLMTRLPNALRQTFTSFLSTNFDSYCSLLRLPSSFMSTGLEVYLNVFMSNTSQRSILEDVIKEMQLTLSFSPSVAPQLRTLNVNIPRSSCTSFINNGNPTSNSANSPFLTGLSAYLEKHLAMKLDLGDSSSKSHKLARQHVRLSKIACGGFVLGSEGRMKLVGSPGRAESANENQNDEEPRSERGQLMLRASEALLQSVIQRAVASESQAT